MSLAGFEFGEFFLDMQEKGLRRAGKPVPITPKAFQLLYILVKNHPRLVEKEQLLNEVWTDSFVEEGNLKFTISLLRKALDDNSQTPRFIETIARRGYRFVAEVREVFVTDDSPKQMIQPTVEEILPAINPSNKRKAFTPVIAAVILLFGVIFAGSWYVRSRNRNDVFPVLSTPFSAEMLSTDGKVYHPILSPDGKNVFYVNMIDGKQGIWLRQLDSSKNIEIIPTSEDIYAGMVLSPDGNYLYFSRKPRYVSKKQFDIFRISVFGGSPQKVIGETHGWIDVSPDGSQLSFVRCDNQPHESCSLRIADSADGKNERQVAVRDDPYRISANRFSPDGKKIVFAAGQSLNSANDFGLAEVNLETGAERAITTEKFFDITSLDWLPDQSALLVAAARIPNKSFHIWQTSVETGEVRLLTKDSESFVTISLDAKADKMVVTNRIDDFRLTRLNLQNPLEKHALSKVSTSGFAPDGRILFSSAMSGNEEIWVSNPDGTGKKQLTNEFSDEIIPLSSPDNNFIYFASNRTGAVHIWRMNADGSDQTRLTKQDGGYPLAVSPDGKWIYYQHGVDRTLWRVATDGSLEQIIFPNGEYRFAISRDATQAVFTERHGDETELKIVSLADKKIVAAFKPALEKNFITSFAWMPDGKNLIYIQTNGTFSNFTLWRQSADGHQLKQLADLGGEFAELSNPAVSSDEKSLIFRQGFWRSDAILLKGIN